MVDDVRPADSEVDDVGGEPDSGVEAEEEQAGAERIEHPFDPEKLRVRTVNVVVSQVVSRIEHGEIDLAPEFQRLRGVWQRQRKSRLVESLLLRIPLPVFYVSADDDENWAVVDGLQRFSTFYDYIKGKFRLSGLEYLSLLDGCRHRDLPRQMQRRISETQLVVNVIDPGTPDEVMFNIFYRINTGGQTLNRQEIRHAMNPGPARKYLEDLAGSDEFKKATAGSISVTRMDDRDCVLHFLAFHIDPWEEYSANDVDGYLGSAMKKINRMDSRQLDLLTVDFKKAMRAAADIFGERAFRKVYAPGERRKPINKALFGAWSVALARRSPQQISVLVGKRGELSERLTELLNEDREFETSISSATGVPARVRTRFSRIDRLVEECL